jgi:O-antigen/teichoic acid export membrane protein
MQSTGALSAWRLAGQVVYGVVTPLVVGSGLAGVRAYAWCNILGYLVTALGALVWVWRSHGRPFRPVSVRALARRVVRSMPFGVSLVMVQIYVSLDFLLLGYLSSSTAVGQYAAAAKIPLALTGLASVWVVILYPHAASLFTRDREALRRQVSRFTGLGIVVALPLLPIGFLAGKNVVTTLFGSAFAPAAIPFAVLLCSAGVVIVNSNVGNLLLACNDEKSFLAAVTAGAAVNLGLNFLLIPPYGPTGSAVATLAAESLVFGSMAWRFQRVVGPISLERPRLASATVATLALTASLLLVSGLDSVWIQLSIAAIVYPAVLVATRGITMADLAALRGAR